MYRLNSQAFFLFLFFISLSCGFSGCGSNEPRVKTVIPQIGDKVVDFGLTDQNGQFTKLSAVPPNAYLVLIFYRGAWCNACQEQLFQLKKDFHKFVEVNTLLAAVSTDPVEDSAQYNHQWNFPFPLLADPQLKLIDWFGFRNVRGHGIYDVSYPAVVIIDPQKIIRFKSIGKNPIDLPTNAELVFMIKQMQNGK